MPMHIIIDGYNLIRNSAGLSDLDRTDIQLGREALLELLTAYRRIKRHKITVVFDGAAAPTFSPKRDHLGGIDIKFSRSGESADTVIKRMARREKEQALVVTSDREIQAAADACRAAVIDSAEFDERLRLAGYLSAKGLEDDPGAGGWVPTTRKKGPGRRLPKRQRRNRMKTRKL
jgi:predicted RNA-binding protein with PIN domain